jgi:hemolysin activation/secretion protein
VILALLIAAASRPIAINEYRVEGSAQLSQAELEHTLAPFLGPDRTLEDVEKARAALEKAYSDKGFQSVSVAIPPQTVKEGVVVLAVTEGRIDRLRVRGARWFLPSEIRELSPSVAEGAVPNFNDIVRDIFLLNQLPDRRVTPSLRAGELPGTVDVDLEVKDSLPLHGSVEFNNRYSAGTTVPRLNGSLRYDNLFQLGHSLSLSFQIAPERPGDGEVFSGAYLMRFARAPWLSFSFTGIWQDSDISTLGETAIRGRGRIFGGSANFTLPSDASFFQTLSLGLNYKHFGRELDDPFAQPIVYWPMSALYGASLAGETSQTSASASVVFNLRGLGSGPQAFDSKRFDATGSFIYARLEATHSRELARGFQAFARLQLQLSSDALLPAEQLTGGGVDSVRGYLEAQAAGDYGALGTIELRSPQIFRDARVHAFFEGGRLALRSPLPEQQWLFFLWSTGGGLRVKLLDAWSGSLDLGVPLRGQGSTHAYHPRAQFRIAGEF